MNYQDEETRDEYHKVDTDVQVVINKLEDALAELGWQTAIVDVELSFVPSQIIIRITK